jgi:hypothetical protein
MRLLKNSSNGHPDYLKNVHIRPKITLRDCSWVQDQFMRVGVGQKASRSGMKSCCGEEATLQSALALWILCTVCLSWRGPRPGTETQTNNSSAKSSIWRGRWAEQQCGNYEEVEYYNPQSAQKGISYPTIFIVHEIPRARVNPTPEDDHAEMNPLEELTYISLGNPLLLVPPT